MASVVAMLLLGGLTLILGPGQTMVFSQYLTTTDFYGVNLDDSSVVDPLSKINLIPATPNRPDADLVSNRQHLVPEVAFCLP
eukprot:scaffold897_cov14-Tisochrysis_lutea.AAC.1